MSAVISGCPPPLRVKLQHHPHCRSNILSELAADHNAFTVSAPTPTQVWMHDERLGRKGRLVIMHTLESGRESRLYDQGYDHWVPRHTKKGKYGRRRRGQMVLAGVSDIDLPIDFTVFHETDGADRG